VYAYNDITKSYDVNKYYPPIDVGTRVEVIGAFDSSKPYTKIHFTTKYGTVEAYVETANLKYNGVNVLQVVALALIIVTTGLIIFIGVRTELRKRKRLNSGVLARG
jgi:hypothetical protein